MPRVVLDTNVLVAAAYAEGSASRRIIEAALSGRVEAVASEAVLEEYRFIVERAVRRPDYRDRLAALLDTLEIVEPAPLPRVVPEDPDDDKLLAAAVGGLAGWLVTNDRHLLVLNPFEGVQIVTSGVFAEEVLGRLHAAGEPPGNA
jgi:putative PIN family toxin of toxin-antitoxin system